MAFGISTFRVQLIFFSLSFGLLFLCCSFLHFLYPPTADITRAKGLHCSCTHQLRTSLTQGFHTVPVPSHCGHHSRNRFTLFLCKPTADVARAGVLHCSCSHELRTSLAQGVCTVLYPPTADIIRAGVLHCSCTHPLQTSLAQGVYTQQSYCAKFLFSL